MAGSLIGQNLTIDNNSEAYQQWTVTAGGQLTVNNSRTSSIVATTGSSVILNGATLSDNNELVGVQVRTSTLLMNNSVANGTDTAVIVGRENQADPRGGSAIINNSQINGGLRGIQVASSELELNNSVVTADGTGIDQLQGVVVVNNSQITAGGVGLIMRRTSTGVATDTRVDLNNTRIESGTGAAVTVDNRGLFTSYLNLSNGSSLVGGNGNILEVTRSSNASVTVTDSDLQGNILLDAPLAGSRGAVLDLALSSSSLTGDVDVRQDATFGLALVNNSLLTGDITVEQASAATVGLDASQMVGNINVADTSAATVRLANGSLLTGDVALADASTATLALDASQWAGNLDLAGTSTADVSLGNGSLLTGDVTLADASTATLALDASQWLGNLDLAGTSTADVNLANGSQMTGDISAGVGTTANVVLDSGSLLTGRLENLTSLRIDNDAQWQMVETSTVDNLSLNGGRVRFGEATDFQTLNVGDLTGSGTFVMDVDFATGQRDFLNITGNATGNHELLIASTGTDPVDDTSLHVVHANAGDASFALVGGSVDLGTWSYGLREDNGTDWYLDAAQKTISPGTASVLALFNTAPTVWYGELSSLRSRMGELRHNGGQSGVWSRAYGGKYNVSGNNGLNYSQQQNGFSLGADAALPIGDGQWLAGVLAGYSDSDLSLARGSSGTVKSYYAGLYTTWLDAQSGYYLMAC